MPLYSFEARDAGGRSIGGRQEAASVGALTADLRRRGLLVVGVKAVAPAAPPPRGRGWLRVRASDVELSFRQLAVMLRSGLTLLNALRTLAEQSDRRSMAWVWEDVSERIQSGATLADAVSRHRCFPHLSVQLIRVGEQTGVLENVLTRAADIMENRRMLITTLLTSLAYPTIVLVAAIATCLYMVFGVIPQIARLLASSGRRLPAMTQTLVDVSTYSVAHAADFGIGIALILGSLVGLYLWPPGRLFLDRFILRVPIIGRLLRLAATALFARALGILVGSGVTLLDGLRTVEGLFRNRYTSGRLAEAREGMLRGATLAAGLDDRAAFMPMLSRMVAVGEATGALEQVLDETARFHEDQLKRAIRWLSLLIEPAIIVIVGGIVGFVYVSFFLALFSASVGGGR